MPRYHISTPLNSAQLRDIAATLRHFAGRYDDLAAQVDALAEPLPVTHWISLQDALKEVNKHVSAAFLAYGEAVVKRGSTSSNRRSASDGKELAKTEKASGNSLKVQKSTARAPARSKRG
jgi:hypothetical protein